MDHRFFNLAHPGEKELVTWQSTIRVIHFTETLNTVPDYLLGTMECYGPAAKDIHKIVQSSLHS